eukprot:2547368-Rhodomonas_salina.1
MHTRVRREEGRGRESERERDLGGRSRRSRRRGACATARDRRRPGRGEEEEKKRAEEEEMRKGMSGEGGSEANAGYLAKIGVAKERDVALDIEVAHPDLISPWTLLDPSFSNLRRPDGSELMIAPQATAHVKWEAESQTEWRRESRERERE